MRRLSVDEADFPQLLNHSQKSLRSARDNRLMTGVLEPGIRRNQMSSPQSIANFTISRRRLLFVSASAAGGIVIGRYPQAAFADSVTTTDAGVFLDPSVVHTISFEFDQSDYEEMIDTYVDSGDKDWMEATVTIDGAAYERVGLRLKGNSSLMGLRNGGNGAQNPGTSTDTATPTADAEENGRVMMGGPSGSISADAPESLPWLVRLDRNIDDQNHEGLKEFVIRSNNSETSLNEAVALDLLAEAGLASQRAAYASLSVNDSESKLRLAIENPKDDWMAAHFSADGLLFKSEAEGDWSYRGDAADAYLEAFDLEAGGSGDDQDDYEPLIGWLDFLNNSDDETFVAELPVRLDVPQFANYLAMMDLLRNSDDIDGPGNNSYLYYAPAAEQFTVVPWDMNLALSGMGGMGGGGGERVFRDGQTPPEGGDFPAPAASPEARGDLSIVINGTPVAGGPTFSNGGGNMNGPGGMSNPLTQRFNANEDLAAQLTEATESLRATLYTSGTAGTILDRWVAVLESGATSLVDASTVSSEAESIRSIFTES